MTDAALPGAATPQQTKPAAATSPTRPPLRAPLNDLKSTVAFNGLRKRVIAQAYMIAGLSVLLAMVLPFAGPLNVFYALTPDNRAKLLVPLEMPNMTNRAILSWATTSITEVMTMGFGDMDMRLPKQKNRFTGGGWDSYMKSFDSMKIREQFKQRQLVLTTVPSNTPVIVAQGMQDKRYTWIVQMPIIMTYATNNNVSQKSKNIVHLTIVRIPTDENPFGVAIKDWVLM